MLRYREGAAARRCWVVQCQDASPARVHGFTAAETALNVLQHEGQGVGGVEAAPMIMLHLWDTMGLEKAVDLAAGLEGAREEHSFGQMLWPQRTAVDWLARAWRRPDGRAVRAAMRPRHDRPCAGVVSDRAGERQARREKAAAHYAHELRQREDHVFLLVIAIEGSQRAVGAHAQHQAAQLRDVLARSRREAGGARRHERRHDRPCSCAGGSTADGARG